MTLLLPQLRPAEAAERVLRVNKGRELIGKIRLDPFAARMTTFRLAALFHAEIEAFQEKKIPEETVFREFCLAIDSTASEIRNFLFIHGFIEKR